MITLRYADIVLTVLALCAVLLTGAALAAFLLARSTVADLRRTLQSLQELDETLRATRRVAEKADRILENVQVLSDETRRSAIPVIRGVGREGESLLLLVRQLNALVAGLRAGLAALGRDGTS